MSSKISPDLVRRWDFNARYYFAFPVVPEDDVDGEWRQWSTISQHMELAKRGDFRNMTQLLELFDHDVDWVRRGMYAELLGAAGPDWVLERMLAITTILPVDIALYYVETLFGWGRLDVVPILLEVFKKTYRDSEDAYYILPQIDLLLNEGFGGEFDVLWTNSTQAEVDTYCQLVQQRHSELSQSLGEKAFVFRGRALDVRWVARCLIDDVNKPVPLNKKRHCEQMRGKFEGMTGIDCSPFYKDRRLQCLTTSAILEEFLDSPEVTLFAPGIRYFFSHPVPSLSELEPKA